MQSTLHNPRIPPHSGLQPSDQFGPKSKLVLVDRLNLQSARLRCNSEDGQLRSVAVHPPDFLSWTTDSAINAVECANPSPPTEIVIREHGLLVEALLGEGVDVVMVRPQSTLPEAVYQRDSVVVIGGQAFAAKFKFPVRQAEVGVISGAKSPWKPEDTIEFGDVLVFPELVLVGLSDRTNSSALQTLRTQISDREIIPLPLKPGTLHLDYATTIGGRGQMKTIITCPELYDDTRTLPMLTSMLNIHHVILVSENDYANGWTNVFFVSPDTVISTTASRKVNDQLRKIGFKVIELPFDGILTGQGAPRCCTAPLVRED